MSRTVGLLAAMLCLIVTVSYAGDCPKPAAALFGPSSLLVVPSTDVQPFQSFNVNFDNLVVLGTTAKQAYDSTSFGAAYGLSQGLELGASFISGSDSPVYFNAKYAFAPFGANNAWGFAVGGAGFGTDSDTSANVWYGVASYKFGVDRVTAGFFTGDEDVLAAPGSDDNSGLLLGWDRQLNDKWWMGADFVSGEGALSGVNVGAKYAVSDNSSITLGYNFWANDAVASTLNVQYDLKLGK